MVMYGLSLANKGSKQMDTFDTVFTMALGVFLMFASIVSAMSIDPPFWTLILGIAGIVCLAIPMIATTLND